MADLKAGVQDPATGADATERSPEDQLEAIEKKAEGGSGEVIEKVEAGGAAGAVDDDASVEKVRQFMLKKGINDLGKLVDIASDLESKNTKLDQDVRRLSAVNRFPAGGGGAVQPGGSGRPVAAAEDEIQLDLPENPIDLVMNKDSLKKFATGLVKIGEDRQAKREEARNFSMIQARVQAKMEANPAEFEELKPAMLELSRMYPDADIDQLYSGAKAQMENQTKKLVATVKKELGLTEDQTERLKGLSARLRTTQISSGTGVQVTPAVTAAEKEHKELLDAIRTADKY